MRGSVIIRYIWSTTVNVGYCPRVNGPLAVRRVWSAPEVGVYEPWNAWSSCHKTCGRGVQSRSRLCNHPDGLPCVGPSRETLDCNLTTCPSKGKFLYSAVSSPQDRSKRFTLYFPDRPVHSDTISASLGSIQPYATINARRLLVHISTTVYSHLFS